MCVCQCVRVRVRVCMFVITHAAHPRIRTHRKYSRRSSSQSVFHKSHILFLSLSQVSHEVRHTTLPDTHVHGTLHSLSICFSIACGAVDCCNVNDTGFPATDELLQRNVITVFTRLAHAVSVEFFCSLSIFIAYGVLLPRLLVIVLLNSRSDLLW